MKTLFSQLLQLRNDEGKQTALKRCEELQAALETCVECGSTSEAAMAGVLLKSVNNAIKTIADLP